MQNKPSLVKLSNLRTLFYSIVLVCIGVSAHSAVNHSPIALSLGGAGVAGMDPVEGSYLNPAAIANAEVNHLLLSLGKGESSEVDRNDIHFAAIDAGKASISKGAFSYSKKEVSGDSQRTTQSRWELTAAKYARAGVAYGVSFTKETLNNHKSSEEFVDYNMDFGGVYNHTPQWGFGFLVKDIFSGKESRQIRNGIIGLNYRSEKWFSSFLDFQFQDQENPDRKWITALGLVINTTKQIKWRLGYRADDIGGGNYYSMGFSWIGPRLGIHYGFRSHTKISADNRHILDFRVFF